MKKQKASVAPLPAMGKIELINVLQVAHSSGQSIQRRKIKEGACGRWELVPMGPIKIDTGIYVYRLAVLDTRLVIQGNAVYEVYLGRMRHCRDLDFARRVVSLAEKTKRAGKTRRISTDVTVYKGGQVRVGCQKFTWAQIQELKKQPGWAKKGKSK